MHFSKFFVDRPVLAAVLSIVIFLSGGIAMIFLPVSEYPEVVPPTVVVRAWVRYSACWRWSGNTGGR